VGGTLEVTPLASVTGPVCEATLDPGFLRLIPAKEEVMHFKNGQRFWRGVAAGGLAVMMALPATAAFGQTTIHRDAAHDVMKFNARGGGVAAPRNKTADIVRVRFTHTNQRAVATMRLRDYGGRWEYTGFIKTPARNFFVGGEGHHARKFFALFRGIEDPILVPCDGMSSKVDRAKNTFRVSVPAECLDRPRWVRMGLLYGVHTRDGGGFFDDGLGPDIRRFLSRLRVTARLFPN
jgi:hypothetical protein